MLAAGTVMAADVKVVTAVAAAVAVVVLVAVVVAVVALLPQLPWLLLQLFFVRCCLLFLYVIASRSFAESRTGWRRCPFQRVENMQIGRNRSTGPQTVGKHLFCG